jgi:hypothetical protein
MTNAAAMNAAASNPDATLVNGETVSVGRDYEGLRLIGPGPVTAEEAALASSLGIFLGAVKVSG